MNITDVIINNGINNVWWMKLLNARVKLDCVFVVCFMRLNCDVPMIDSSVL